MFVIFYLENLVDNSESTAWIYLRMSGSGKNLQTCFYFSNKCIYREERTCYRHHFEDHPTTNILILFNWFLESLSLHEHKKYAIVTKYFALLKGIYLFGFVF